MKVHSLKLKGPMRYSEAVELDLSKIPDGLVSVTGGNGAGKTALLEMLGPAVHYREWPTRKGTSFTAPFVEGEGYIEKTWEDAGVRYIARVDVTKSGARLHLARLLDDGTEEVICSGPNVARRYDEVTAGILGPKEAYYVSVFAAQDGAGAFTSLKVSDRKAIFRHYLGLGLIDDLYRAVLDRQNALKRQRGNRDDVEARLAEAKETAETAKREIPIAEASLEAARVEQQTARGLLAEAKAAQSALAVQRAYTSAVAALDKARRTLAEAEGASANAPSVPDGALDEAKERVAAAEKALADCQKQARALAEANAEARQAEGTAQARIDALERAHDAKSRLSAVPCGGAGKYATCPLIEGAVTARTSIPGLTERAQEALRAVEAARAACAALEGPGSTDEAEGAARVALRKAVAEKEAIERAIKETERVGWKLTSARDAVAQAEARVDELLQQVPKGDDGSPLLSGEEVEDLLGPAKRRADLADTAVELASAKLARLGEVLRANVEAASKHEAALQDLKQALADERALNLLQQALGPGGVQAFEIDAAGPEVSRIANELLASCYDDAFQVRLRTLRDKKDGGQSEDFDVEVFDTYSQKLLVIGDLSGGQRVIVEEALRIALCIFQARRLARPHKSLYRDETTGGLTEDNQRRYVVMLEKARQIGGFSHVYYVTHSPTAALAAPTRIHVGDSGLVEVHSGARA